MRFTRFNTFACRGNGRCWRFVFGWTIIRNGFSRFSIIIQQITTVIVSATWICRNATLAKLTAALVGNISGCWCNRWLLQRNCTALQRRLTAGFCGVSDAQRAGWTQRCCVLNGFRRFGILELVDVVGRAKCMCLCAFIFNAKHRIRFTRIDKYIAVIKTIGLPENVREIFRFAWEEKIHVTNWQIVLQWQAKKNERNRLDLLPFGISPQNATHDNNNR